MAQPPLKSLHPDSSLVPSKLEKYRKLSTLELTDSLKPGQLGALKARPDGTIVDGHHRIKVLRERGVDVDSLPREVIQKDAIPDPRVNASKLSLVFRAFSLAELTTAV